MIELSRDQLKFSFPSIADELRDLVENYAITSIILILAEDREAVARAYFAERPWVGESAKRTLRAKIFKLTENSIRDVFSRRVADVVPMETNTRIEFQRTLRLPDDGRTYNLPPGLGRFPIRHIDDYEKQVPPTWLERGGVLMPMYQSEALWINFYGDYPVAIKIGSGKVNAVTGEAWIGALQRDPQDYITVPEQPWLDGFAVSSGVIRQFVAAQIGDGYTVEEQITGNGKFGGIQIQVHPMKARLYFERNLRKSLPSSLLDLLPDLIEDVQDCMEDDIRFADYNPTGTINAPECLGLGMGGRMRQEIYKDSLGPDAWESGEISRCFVHLCNALQWREITGDNPPQTPVTAKEYERAGLPWFDFYRDDLAVLEGSKILAGVKSIGEKRAEVKAVTPISDGSIKVPVVVSCGPKKRPEQVREWVE